MPLPLIPLAIIGVTAAAGVKKLYDASQNTKEANQTNSNAQALYTKARNDLNDARATTDKALQTLGRKKLDSLTQDIHHFVESFSQLHNVNLMESEGLDELSKIQITPETLADMKEQSSLAIGMASGLAQGTAAGSLAAFGAYNAATLFASASTGTAISTLSGAAATNATLAFFGGGSLAAGGLGMAGGTMVLGGLIAGPALAVMGYKINAKAEENLENARSNLAQAKKIKEELDAASEACRAITARTDMFTKLLTRLTNIFKPLLMKMDDIIKTSGTDFEKFTKQEKSMIAMAASVALAVKKVLDTPILTKDGALTDESAMVQMETAMFLKSTGLE